MRVSNKCGLVETLVVTCINCVMLMAPQVDGYGLNQKLLVVSFDGFRQAYFNDNRFLPWFSYFRQQGVYSDQVQSIFPSETFPNHFAIATGKYAENHGIVANHFYDPKLNKSFTKTDTDSVWWNQAEPIWVTAERQQKLTAVSFWPGSPVKYQPGDYTPTFYLPNYNTSVPFERRIDEIVKQLSKEDVDLAMLYFHQPDSDGHANGAPSTNVNDKLQMMDWYLSYLLSKLDQVNLGKDKLNMILCADHGMTNVTQVVFMEDYLSVKEDLERVPSYGPVANVQPKRGKIDYVMAAFQNATDHGAPFKAYRKKDVPAEFHYSNNDRIMDVVVVCNLGVFLKPSRPPSKITGVHGYDPRYPVMRPIFMARGPAFKKDGYRAESVFETKDIYAIIAYVAGINPLRVDADLTRAEDIFAPITSQGNMLNGHQLLCSLYPIVTFFVAATISRNM